MSQTMREALQAAANYIDTLGGDSKRYRCVLASSEQAQQGAERLMDELEAALREDGYEFAHQGPAVCAWIEGLGASRPAATAPAGGVTELPDDIRVPLDSLHADALYLTSRVAQSTMSAVRLSQVIRERIDAAKAALAGAAQGAEPDAWRFQWRNGDVGFMDAGETADRLRKGVVGEDGTAILNPDSGRTNWKPLVYAASPQPPTGTEKKE